MSLRQGAVSQRRASAGTSSSTLGLVPLTRREEGGRHSPRMQSRAMSTPKYAVDEEMQPRRAEKNAG
jgi:hypothetical protein